MRYTRRCGLVAGVEDEGCVLLPELCTVCTSDECTSCPAGVSHVYCMCTAKASQFLPHVFALAVAVLE